MKTFLQCFTVLFTLCFSINADASWLYNENAGFGIYQPEGWTSSSEGRSTTLSGPLHDSAQSEIFLGSDWSSRVRSLEELRAYAIRETGDKSPRAIKISGLDGFATGKEKAGAYFVLRSPENFIVVEFDLKGSSEQLEEGETMLGSIDIRTRGNEGR